MVLTPEEARKLEALTPDEQQFVKTLEQKIDYELKRNYTGKDIVTVSSLPTRHGNATLNKYVIQKIRELYEHAGWNVQYTGSQRDNGFFKFAKRTSQMCTSERYDR